MAETEAIPSNFRKCCLSVNPFLKCFQAFVLVCRKFWLIFIGVLMPGMPSPTPLTPFRKIHPFQLVYLIIFIFLMKSNNFSFSRINLNTLSMFYSQCDNKGSMYKLEVKVIDDVNSAAICIHMEFIFILQLWVFWIVGMSYNAKCETF